MGADVSSQLLTNPRPLFIAGGVVGFLGILPGMPHLPFLALAAGAVGIAYVARQRGSREIQSAAQENEAALSTATTQQSEKIESVLRLDSLALEVGYGLI